jgi:hypothetical protein
MPMPDIEQSPLSVCSSFLSTGYPTGRTKATLASETHLVDSTAVITPILNESVALRPAGKRLAGSIPGSFGNDSGQAFVKQPFYLLPMVRQNRKKKTSATHADILSHGGFLRKSTLFFLGTH